MTKSELCYRIALELCINGVLNESDYPNTQSLMNECSEIIEKNLQDYMIIRGEVIQE